MFTVLDELTEFIVKGQDCSLFLMNQIPFDNVEDPMCLFISHLNDHHNSFSGEGILY